MTALPEQQEYDRDGALDGLRAIAIILVLLRHLPNGDPNLGWRAIPFKIADAGWVGVDLFFVLSGFLITGILLRTRTLPHRFRSFYARRSLRIFPLYYLALVIAFFLPPLLAHCSWVDAREQLPYWLYFANFRSSDIVSSCVRVGHFWSLAIEEQYYAIWPAVVFLASMRAARRICIGIVLLAIATRIGLVLSHSDWRAYYWTHARADALACGSLVAFAATTSEGRRLLSRWSLPIAIVTGAMLAPLVWWNRLDAVFRTDATAMTQTLRVLVPFVLALFFSAMLVLALERRPFRRVLDNAPFRFLARYSYGIYVWHLMVIELVIRSTPMLPIWARAIAAALASVLAAMLSYHLFEVRFLALKRYFPSRSLNVPTSP